MRQSAITEKREDFCEVRHLMLFKELKIEFCQYEHPVVLTVEAQAKYVGHAKGGLSKNLFLKDKKNRYYVISALADTKIDLKILSQRLGLGKGGLRMAPEEALSEILQVPLGCVTPFALVNESARHVSLLLDEGFKTKEFCFFHPLSNDMSISLSSCDVDKFLKSIGREPLYVDLEANPPVGKDNPPDLADIVPSDVSVTSFLQEKTASSVTADGNSLSVSNLATITAKVAKPSTGREGSTIAAELCSSYSDPEKFVEEFLDKASAIVVSEINKENINLHGEQLGAVVTNSMNRLLSSELKNLATIYKNTAYVEGFAAGKCCQPKRL